MKTALIVGSGPAGLMAADVLSDCGIVVTLAEAKPSFARKFLMAGKSGLNLTMDQPLDDFMAQYGGAPIAKMVQDFGSQSVVDFAHGLGQETFVGTSKRVFPKAMKASPFLRAWLARLRAKGVVLNARWHWTGLPNPGAPHVFQTPGGTKTVIPDATILALGGGSWARLGSTGEWMAGFMDESIPCTPFAPSNMGVQVDWSDKMTMHHGQPVKSVAMHCSHKRIQGEMIVSKRGLEGGLIYAFSPEVRAGAKLFLDLLPDFSQEQITMKLAKPKGKQSLSNHLRKTLRLPGIKRALLHEWAHPLPQDPADLAQLMKALPLPPLMPFPLDEAISTAGGLSFDAMTEDLMLRSHPGVFCAGEMLDWDAPTGGYLITACLASGRRAAIGTAAYLTAKCN
ncbi:MAG: TIGR03862 family flavoprotein [Planktomarina sp.]